MGQILLETGKFRGQKFSSSQNKRKTLPKALLEHFEYILQKNAKKNILFYCDFCVKF